MTNIWKRSISMLLALVMVVGMLPVQAFATETEQNTEETSVTEPVVIETTAPVVEETAEPSQTTEETSAPEPVPEETTAATESVAESTEATEAAQETTVPAETEAVTEETTEVTEETAAPVETEAAEEAVTEPVEETEPAQETQIVATRECYNVVPSVELPSDEELFAAYAEQQFYGEMAAFGTAAGRRLSGDEKLAYDALVPVIKQIASGERASAKIALGVSLGEVTFGDGSTGVYNADVEVAFNGTTFPGDSLHRVINALLTDLPYEMYWYDKTIGVSDMVIVADSQMHIVFEFAVAGPYMGSNLLTANTAKTGAAKTAAANAKAVVDSIAADASIKTDYDKLIAYRDWICANVAYNTSAANGGNFSENADPWQMIYVFDGNSATNVVCEGYSKAFQYLCDLSEFEADITCYTVTGTMAGGTGAGGHMWNIVEIDGQHYLADVTNSDSGTVGDDGSLFLVGGPANNDGSYTFNGVHFIYDTDTQELWDGTAVLTLDTVNYEPKLGTTNDAEAKLREALAASVGQEYILRESVTLTEDLEVNIRTDADPWLNFGIAQGATLTVSSGVTLTLYNNAWIEGELILEDGATLAVGKTGGQYYSSLNVHGKLTAAAGANVTVKNNGGIHVYDGSAVSGISTNKLIREKTVSTLAELKSAMAITGYQQVQIFMGSNLTVAETLTIPDGCSVYVMNDGKSFTIANGGHVIVDGFFSVQSGAVLNVNAGGTMTINGDAISYGGIINNNGTINGYFQINSQGGQEMSEADFITAVENSNGFYNLADHVVITGNVTLPENVTVWVTNTGSLTVANGGKLTVNSQLSTGNSTITIDGTLVNNGFMSLDYSASGGKIVVNGTLQNNAGLSILGGQLVLNGTYTAGESCWVDYDPQATITNITKIGTANIGLMDIVATEGELRSGLTKRNGYKYQQVYVNEDITLTSNLTIPSDVGLNIGYSWRSQEANQYGLTVGSGVTLTNNSYIHVGEKFYLHINSGATLVNNGEVWVNGGYQCNGTVTGNSVQVQGGGITQDEFEAKLEAAGGNWVQLTQALTLERDLTIDSGFGVAGQGFLVVPNGVTLTINNQMSISSMVRVENGGKLVMGENAHINLDGAANLTFESNADLSGLRKGHIHQNIDFGATVDGLDKSYIEMICAIYMPEDFEDALSCMEMGYHSGRFEVKSVLVLEDDVTLPANVILSAFEPTGQGVLEIHVLENFINKGSIEIGERTSLIVDGTMENQGNVNVYEGGSLQVAGSGTLINNGGLWNYGGTIHVAGRYENNGHVEGDVNVAGQMTQAELEAAMAECVANGNDWVQNTKVILDSDMTINLNDRNFCIAEGGAIIVPDGVTLHVNSYVTLDGGKLIILEGGTLRTTAPIDAQNGILFFQYDAMWNIQADIYGQRLHEVYGDIASSLAVYPCNDYGSGATADWNRPMSHMQIMPGMWSQALFCLREWDYVNYEWKNTVIRPDQLLGGQYLHVMALADTENPPMFAPGDANVENYVTVMAEKVFAESEVKFNHDGIDYSMPVTIGPGNHGFFSQPVATVENYLGFGYTIDPDAAENSFYYMFFGDKDGWKIDNFQVVNNPFDMQPVDQVTWTKVSDTVYKITVKPECWNQSFPVHVQVEVSNANFGMSNTWGIGQLWVEPFMSYDPWLGFVWLNNDGNGEGWYENPNDEPNRMDGMWAQDEFYGIFYMHQWDESKQLWVGTPVIPTATGDYVTITPVKNLPGHTIKAGQNHANYFVQVKGNGPLEGLSGGKLNFTCNGTAMSQDFNLYPCDVAWYDANETTLDAFISTGGAEVELDYSKAENAYYLKLLDTSKFTIRNFSWGVNTWGEDYDQYVSDGEFITMTDLGNGTFKFTLDPEYVALTKYIWKNFCLYADVQYGSPNGMMNNNWHGEIWINPPEGEFHEPDAELFIDGQIFAFFDGLSYPMRWEFTGDYDDQGREIMKLVKAELPAGVSYDLGSNKLRLNNATLQNLEVGYYWKDENGRPLPVEEFGSRVPNPNFFLELVGNNTINGQHDWAAILAHSGVNLNVVGNGTLTITGNGEGYPAIDITPEATACFQSGTIRLENSNLWFGGIIDWDGTNLIGNDSYFNVDNMLTLDSGNITLNGGALHVSANMTMNDGEIVLNDSMLYNGTAFTQNGGTITANNNAGRDPAIVVDCYYALNGGNINITQNDGLSAMAVWGTFHQMGGTVDIRGAKGITVVTTWDNNGNVVVDENGNKRVGSLLLNDGEMTITGTNGKIVGLDVNPESSAFLGGGNLTLTNADICDGGEIKMTHMTDDSVMTVNLNNADFNADNAFIMENGTLNINNGVLVVNNATNIYGGTVTIENNGMNGISANGYFCLPQESTATINVRTQGAPAVNVWGTFHQMGGTVNIEAREGIIVATTWDENNQVMVDQNGNKRTGSLLLNDGVLNITGPEGDRGPGIGVHPESEAFLGGGTLTLNNANIGISGELMMTHMTDTSELVVTLNNGDFYVGNAFDMHDGELYINNGTMTVENIAGIHGGHVQISNGAQNAIVVNNYFFLPEGSNAFVSAITDGAPAIVVNGTYHQMGGNVYATDKSRQAPGMLSNGATLINDGYLNANGRVGFAQGYNFDWNNPDPNSKPGMMITGGTLSARGEVVGFAVNGPVIWNGGTVNAHAEGPCDNSTGTWAQAVQVQEFSGNKEIPYLEINGGEHYLTAVDTSGSGASSKGLMIGYAPVIINGGMVNIDAEQALWSLGYVNATNISSMTGVVTYLSMDSGEYLDIHGEMGADYCETLMENDGSYAGKVLVSVSTDGKVPMTQGRLEALLREAAANGTGVVLEENLTLVRDLELNAHLTIKNNAELIVPAGVTLTNKEDRVLAMVSGGRLNVSGDLVNYGYLNVGEYQKASLNVNGTLTNYGVFRVFKDGTADIGGYLKNIRPEDLTQQRGLVIVYGTMNAAEVYNSRWICADGGTINITGRLENAGELSHDNGGKNNVETLVNYNGAILNVFNGHLTVNNVLNNNGELHANQGSVTVNGRYIHGQYAVVYNGSFDGTVVTIKGIDTRCQTVTFNGNNATWFNNLVTEMGKNEYAGAYITINGNMNLPQNTTLGIGTEIWVHSGTLTIPAGKTLKLYGNLVIEKTGAVTIQGELRNYGAIHVNGTLTKPAAGKVFNGTVMNVFAGGRVSADGENWTGYNPWKMEDGAIIDGTAMGMTQSKFEHALAEAERGEYRLELSQVVTLTRNLTINADVTIAEGGGIVVPKGITLTINGFRNSEKEGWFGVNDGGSLVVDGTLVNNASFWLYKGARMDVNGTVNNNKWFQTGRYPEDSSENAVLELNGTFNNNYFMHLYSNAVMNVNAGAVLNGKYTFDEGDYRGFIHVADGELNLAGTLNNYLRMDVENGGVLNVEVTGTLKNLTDGNIWGMLQVGENALVRLRGTMVNDTNIYTFGNNPQFLTFPGSKLTNNGYIVNEGYDAIMDVSNAEYVHGTNAYAGATYFADGSVSTIKGISNDKILLQLYETSEESVVNAMTKYGYDNGYLAQIVHYQGDNIIDEELFLQPGTELLVTPSWYNGEPNPGNLTLDANVEILQGAGIFVRQGSKLIVSEGVELKNRDRIMIWDGSQLIVNGTLNTYPGSATVAWENAVMTIGENATVINRQAAFVGEVGSHVIINGKAINNRGDMLALGTYELGENAEVRNSAFNGTISNMRGYQTKDLHLDAYFTEGATQANVTNVVNQIKSGGYRSAELFALADMTLNTLEIPANVTMYIGNEVEGGQVIPVTVTVNGQVTNMGKIQERKGGKLVMNGTLVGMPPVDEFGNSDFISQAELEEMLKEGGQVILEKSVFVSGNLTIDNELMLDNGGELIVVKGATLTVNGTIHVMKNAVLNVQAGGKLQNNGTILQYGAIGKDSPVVSVAGTYVRGITEYGNDAQFVVVYNEEGVAPLTGIAKNYVTLNARALDEADLREFFTFANGYGIAEIYIVEDMTLAENLIIPANARVIVDGTLTVPAGKNLTNNGKLFVNGSLQVNGTFLGNEPVVEEWNTNIITQSQFEQELAEQMAMYGMYYLTKRVLITEDLTLGEKTNLNISGGELVITNNATLTNNANISVFSEIGSAITVEEGSKFINNANLSVDSDGVKMAPGSYVHGAQAKLYVNYTDSEDGYTVANIEGVDKSYQTLRYDREEMTYSAQAQKFFDAAQDYRGGQLRAETGMTVDKNLTVPENVSVLVGVWYGELIIEHATLTNEGHIATYCTARVNGTLVNNGKLENNRTMEIAGGVENNGQLINRGVINRAGGADYAEFFSVPGGITNLGEIEEGLLVYRVRVTTEAQLQSAAASGVDIIVIEQDMTLTKALTIPADTEVIIPAGVTVTVNVNGAITNNGSVHMAGTLNFVKGNMQGNKVNVVGNGTVENAPEGSYLLVGVRPESFELGASMLVAPTNVPVELFVKNIKPMGADYIGYDLIENSDIAQINKETNTIVGEKAGTVTVQARLILSYDENNNPVYSDITHEITIRFILQAAYIEWLGTTRDEYAPIVLTSGSNVVFNGDIRTLDENNNWSVSSNLTNTKLVWSLLLWDEMTESFVNAETEAFATLTVNGNKATVTAKNVTEQHRIMLNVTAADGSTITSGVPISIRPKLEKVNLFADDMDVTGKTITYDVNGENADLTMALALAGTPADAYDPSMEFFVANNGYVGAANWTTSNVNIATVDGEGNVVFTGETGTVKITATTNGSVKKSATVTINVIETPDYIEFVEPVTKLIGGQAVNYKLQGVFLDDNGEVERTETLLASAVKWGIPSASGTELVSGDSYVSINAQGKLTTKAVEAPHNVRVCAEYTIGGTVKRTFADVVLYPAVNNVEVMESGKVVNGLTIFGDLDNYSHKTLSLKGYPADGSIKEVQWTSSNVKIAGFVNAKGELVNSITTEGDVTLAANADKTADTVTITATAIAHNGTKKAVTFKVTYGYFVKSIDVLDQDGNAVNGEIILASNDNMTLTAKTSIFGADGGDIDLASVDTFDLEQPKPTNPKVTWKLADAADSAYLTVDNGVLTAKTINNGVLTAKTINNPVIVDVVVVAQDGFGTYETISVKLQPATVKVDGEATSPLLLRSHSAEGPYVTKTTVLVEYNKDNNKTLKLFAENGENVSWTSSNTMVATVDEAGVVTVVGKGIANITAKAADGRTAMVTIKGDKMSTGVKVKAKNSLEDGFVVASGKTLSLVGTVAYTDGTSDQNVTWTVTDRDGNATAAAKIAANGTLTATANLTEVTTVYVQAMAKDGAAVSDRIEVTIKPLATGVQISNAERGILNNLKMTWDFGNNGTDKLQLNAAVFAENACQKVKWTSSNKAVASVDENTGLVTFHKAGNVTITATTTDGSNKKATVTLTVSKLMTSLELKSDASIVVMGGKSVKLAPYAVVDSEATNKKLTWTILEGSDFATINANTGELKAKNVTTVQRALVEVSAVDGSELAATTYVTIYPATTKVEIWKDGMEDITGQTIAVYDSNKLHLGAKTVPVDTMMFDGTAQWQWTSSDATGSIAVDQYGVVTVVGGGVTATITAKAMDGSNKTATIKIQSVQPVTEICFGEDGIPETQKLAGGLSLDLSKKVVFNNGGTQPTNKKLTWQVAEEDATYATINANGVLKANKIDIQKTITVIATATDGWTGYGEPVHAECEVELWPATTKVQILQGETDVTNKNVPLYLGGQLGMEQTTFGVLTTPNGAMQTMKWSIAAKDQQYVTLVNEWGEEVTECVGTNVRVRAKVGGKTINVTATTMDGTNKKATVKVQTFQLVNEIHMEDQILAGGLSLNLNTKASVNADATNKKLNWEFVNPADKEFATLSNGTLKAVKRNDKAQPVTVKVRATAADYGAYSVTREVTILPATTKLQIMNHAVDMTNKTIDLCLGGAEELTSANLNILTTPAAALQTVKWTVAAKDQQYVTLLADDGSETAEYVGANVTVKAKVGGKTVNVTAATMDGTNRKYTVRIRTAQLVTDMHIDEQILGVGRTLNLATMLTYNRNADAQPTNKKVVWSLYDQKDAAYVTLDANNGSLKAVKLPAGQETHDVRIMVKAQDGSQVDAIFTVKLYPATTKLQIMNHAVDMTNKTIDLCLGGAEELTSANLNILTTPAAALQTVKWTVAAKDQQYVTLLADDGSETAEYVGANVTVKAKVGGKTVNVTAATMDGTNRKYTVRIRTAQLVTDMHVDDQILAVGRTVNLASKLTYNQTADAQPTNKKVVWSLDNQTDALYVNLNASNGSLRALKLPANKETYTVNITVKAQDGSLVEEKLAVTLYPATTKLNIMDKDVNVTNKTIKLYVGKMTTEEFRNSCDLNVDIQPTKAFPNVKWTIADKDKEFLSIDETTGKVEALKGGRTVTVTVTAQDGTNMRATVKIQTVQLMDDMEVINQPAGNEIHVAAGKTMALKINALPTNTANKNVTWEIAEIDEETAKYVTLNAAGTLKVAQNLPRDMELIIRATAKDEGGLYKDFTVKLYKQITMSIRLTAPTTTIGVGHSLNLVARSLPSTSNMTAAQKWLWTSSNAKIATVDENGTVEAVAAGTVTITCKAVDGSGKTATIKITVTK